MDAIEILRKDHRRLSDLFSRFDAEGERNPVRKMALFQELRQELQVHSQVAEEVFYPAVERFESAPRHPSREIPPHRQIEEILAQLAGVELDEAEFGDHLNELRRLVDRHICEEEFELIPAVGQAFSPRRLEELGREMEELKTTLSHRKESP